MRIDSTGNVGIGTTSPQDLLNVNGQMRWGGTTSNYAYSGQDGSGLWLEQVGNTAAKSKIRLQSSKSADGTNYSQFFIDPTNGFSFGTIGTGNGNVGIGTTSPLSRVAIFPENVNNNQQLLISGAQPVANLNDVMIGFNAYGSPTAPTRVNTSYNSWIIGGRTYTADANAVLYTTFTTASGTNYTPIQIAGASTAAGSSVVLQGSGGNVGIGAQLFSLEVIKILHRFA